MRQAFHPGRAYLIGPVRMLHLSSVRRRAVEHNTATVERLLCGVSNRIWGVLVPEGLLVLAAVATVELDLLRGPLAAFFEFFPSVVFTAGLLLAWRFERGRAVFGLLLLAVAERVATWAASSATGTWEPVVLLSAGVLIPVNLVALALLPDRGTFTRSGALRLAFLTGEVALVALLARPEEAWVRPILELSFLPVVGDWTMIGDPALLTAATAVVVLAIRSAHTTSPLDRGLLWATVAATIAVGVALTARATVPPVMTGSPIHPSTVFFTAAGLALLVSTVEASHSLAYRDALTGLPSRRALDDALDRLSGRYAIAMVDIDRFKPLNDQHGHDVGDQVLRMVATVLTEVGGGGRAYRYGGEEFALVFPRKGIDDTLPHLQRVRQAVESSRFALRAQDRPLEKPAKPKPRPQPDTVAVTVSMGVAASSGSRTTAPASVLVAADEALYRAKRGGRNRIGHS